jgi:AraC family transcriptional regulator of adaptative response / DNA-3-methyladenine glycosylase II
VDAKFSVALGDDETCYRALTAKDDRFDGVFFVGVKTTGIYCRPVCTARTPRKDRCEFFISAALAEKEGYRACFRCRPERAPGHASIDAVSRVVKDAVARIESGADDVEVLARAVGVSSRHLRRAMRAELGVSPLELATSRKMALARELLHDGTMSVTEVAFASGFSSVRRFNDAFLARHGRPPSQFRRARARSAVSIALDFRTPYEWPSILGFLRARAIPGVEHVTDRYARTVEIEGKRGFIVVTPGERSARLEVSDSLRSVLMPIVARVRRLFDLDAHPASIDACLAADRTLAPLVRARPGLRVPGVFDPFEASARAVLGQQVSVAAATTLAGRVAAKLGEPIETPIAELSRTWPDPARVRAADISKLGILPARVKTLKALASFDFAAPDPIERLLAVPGIGPWTAQYIAMRALAWPDAFPEGDAALKKLGVTASRAQAWRPWRAYAVMHMWRSLS